MDRYKKLMCVKGLLMSLDEQIYKIDQEKGKTVINPKKMQEVYNDVIDQYWDAIKEQLGFPNEKERLIKELHKQGLISAEDKLKLLNVKEDNDKLQPEPLFNLTIIVNSKYCDFHEEKISWEQVVGLAELEDIENDILSVTYNSGNIVHADQHIEGTFDVLDKPIKVSSGMVFNVAKTNKA